MSAFEMLLSRSTYIRNKMHNMRIFLHDHEFIRLYRFRRTNTFKVFTFQVYKHNMFACLFFIRQ